MDLKPLMAIFLVTGNPGVGKTTAVMRVSEALKLKGLRVGGVVSREVRKDNERVGFEFVDLATKKSAPLSSTAGIGPRMGRYFVDLDGCRFAVEVLSEAMRDADAIICDELGPMEFKSKEFVDCARNMLELEKPVIVVVHKRLRHPVIDEFRKRAILSINIDPQNRNKVPDLLLDGLK